MEEIKREPTPVLLAVLAHPDDESFGMGGTLALYAQRGAEVHLVCATRGESGDVVPELMQGFNSIAEKRVAELQCAAKILGLAGVHFLDYRDSGMPGTADNQHPKALAAAPVEEVTSHIAHYIRQVRPQVVLTFDPIGGYRHPDHVAIHNATVKAYELVGDPEFEDDLPPYKPQKLYYHVFPKKFLRLAVRVLPLFGKDPHRFGRNEDIDLAALVEEGDFPINAVINIRSVEDLKDEASACHASQIDGRISQMRLVSWLMRRASRKELFMRAYPPPEAGIRERDLFEGVEVVWAD